MAKFEVGDRVKCLFDEGNPKNGWNGFGVVDKVPSFDIPTLYGVAMEGDKGYYAHLRAEEMELATAITVFQPGDVVRAEKGDEIIQGPVNGFQFTMEGDVDFYFNDLEECGYTLTLVKRPEPEIVLPTKYAALVNISGDYYIRGNNGWFNAFSQDKSEISPNEIAERIVETCAYELIFEGENE